VGGAKNTALIAVDVLGGAWLVYVALSGREGAVFEAFYVLAVTLLLTHTYREWEYLVGVEDAFCADGALFAFNNFRLLGLAAVFVFSL
jgi:hypothetical protein